MENEEQLTLAGIMGEHLRSKLLPKKNANAYLIFTWRTIVHL